MAAIKLTFYCVLLNFSEYTRMSILLYQIIICLERKYSIEINT